MEANKGGYLPNHEAAKKISTTSTEWNDYFSIDFSDTKNGRKLNSRRAILSPRLLGSKKYLLFTPELANQRAPKALFT